MIDKDRLLKSFIELARVTAPSGREGAMGKTLIRRLKNLGLDVSVDDSADKTGGEQGNIVARLDPSEGREDWIALTAHMDTVPLSHPTRPIVRNGVVYSDGTTVLGADDRAGIASILEAIEVLKKDGSDHPGIEVIFTVSEEVGLLGSKALDLSKLKSSMAFVFDSSTEPGSIITTAPFATSITWTVIGLAAHAGVAPEKGINAIQAASRGIASLRIGRIDEETTANVGTIKGGHAINVVCDRVEIKAEARSLKEDKLKRQILEMRTTMKRAIAEYGATLEEKVAEKYPGYFLTADAPVVVKAVEAVKAAQLIPKITSTGGGSDANVLNYGGLPSVNLGLGYQRAHTNEESLERSKLEAMAKVALEIVRS